MSLSAVLSSAMTLGGVGFVFGSLIVLAHRRFRVDEDPRIDVVADLLPGTNCGACGQAGCRALAEALVGERAQPAVCTVMGPEEIADVAELLGVEAGEVHKRVARLACAGGSHVAVQQADYLGLQSCAAAAEIAGGGKGCPWGCLGLTDCADVCDLDAIFMNRNDLPVVVPDRCTACGDCVEACPLDLFSIMPLEHQLLVQCKSLLVGDEAEELCRVACNGCGKCALDAADGVISMVDGLAVIDYEKNDLAGPQAIERCPTAAIVWLEGAQFGRDPGMDLPLQVVPGSGAK